MSIRGTFRTLPGISREAAMPGWLFWGGVLTTPVAACLGAEYASLAGGLFGNVAANLVLLGPSLIITHVVVENWRRKRVTTAAVGQLERVSAALGETLDSVVEDLSTADPALRPALRRVAIPDRGLDLVLRASVMDHTSTILEDLANTEHGAAILIPKPRSLTLAGEVARLQIAIAGVQLTNSPAVETYFQQIIDAADSWDDRRGRTSAGHDLLEQAITLVNKMKELRRLLISGLPVDASSLSSGLRTDPSPDR
ncbi:hypothetical protein GCM10010168_26230 [Actinoplanes ianthinogenes]|uniref:Uncharacterized protein n=1 Tax=Actinoplanes ianthinogenes TaxID=122358 RepID=A0ABM7M9B9_9ACTN|nr:hypothetical protein [Actinoplanes ianthinogenes]BCJ48263.1 hypothetical protein Aiant_89200 [Actinoplanes ianthinogenes]GGR07531.1 hypothetical protein GCM10010168_26230 [Actinoplanes ianthinogenes]